MLTDLDLAEAGQHIARLLDHCPAPDGAPRSGAYLSALAAGDCVLEARWALGQGRGEQAGALAFRALDFLADPDLREICRDEQAQQHRDDAALLLLYLCLR